MEINLPAMHKWESEDTNTVYFWGGILSNWYKAETLTQVTVESPVKMTFNCVEQYMMAQKALTFDDYKSFFDVMNTTDPSAQKSIGRKIVGFNDTVWKSVSRDFVYPAIYDKFSQNWKLGDDLISTEDKMIVEASPYDSRWGIGFSYLEAPANKDKWGENFLGQLLMQVREDIKNNVNRSFTKIDWSKWETPSYLSRFFT